MDNEVYYKIYYYEPEDHVTVVCMQWFDEGYYHEYHFFRDEDGNILKFYEEINAINWVFENIKDNKIDPELNLKVGFNQKRYMK